MGYRQYSIEDDSQEAALHVEKALHHANKALWHMGKTMALVQAMCEGGGEVEEEMMGNRYGYRGGGSMGNRSNYRSRSNYRKEEEEMMPGEYDEFGNPENFRRSRDSMGRYK